MRAAIRREERQTSKAVFTAIVLRGIPKGVAPDCCAPFHLSSLSIISQNELPSFANLQEGDQALDQRTLFNGNLLNKRVLVRKLFEDVFSSKRTLINC